MKECRYDYGPVYSFWLFSFERLNGIMGSYPTNNQSVEVQLMNKHLRSWQLKFTDNEGLSKIFCEAHETKGTLAQQGVESYEGDTIMYQELSNQALSANYLLSLQQSSNTDISILSQKYNCVFSSNEVESLNSLYKSIFQASFVQVFSVYAKFFACKVRGVIYGANRSRYHKSSYVQVNLITSNELSTSLLQPCYIQYFVQHNILVKDSKTNQDKMLTVVCAK